MSTQGDDKPPSMEVASEPVASPSATADTISPVAVENIKGSFEIVDQAPSSENPEPAVPVTTEPEPQPEIHSEPQPTLEPVAHHSLPEAEPEFEPVTTNMGDNDRLDDPFAPRDGKTLTWRNVNMNLKAGKKGEEDRVLLDHVWGEVPNKQITAIMGPSGSGKTSLLNILAGRTVTKGNLTVDADIRLNNFGVNPSSIEVRKQIAFVAQDDSLQITSTPRECIKFSAKLRLPRSITEEQLDSLTSTMLEELGLTHCADTYVGGALLKGISGGERKRTSVGVELVTKPSLVFLDEPTSGLDSYSAERLVSLLHKIADAGSSVLFTIHQPASEVFNSFDHVLLLKKGRVLYSGTALEVPEYFAARSHPMPDNYNPSDWIMEVAQQQSDEDLLAKGFFPKDERPMDATPADNEAGNIDAIGNSVHSDASGFDSRPPSIATQIKLLFGRELLNLKRDTTALVTRFGLVIFMNGLFGIIFWRVGDEDKVSRNIAASHLGAYILLTINTMFGVAQPALFAIPNERPVFLREYSTNHYNIMAYFGSKLTMEAITCFMQMLVQNVIAYNMMGFQANFAIFQINLYLLALASTAVSVLLGCAIEDPKMSQELLPMVFVPQMLFSGFFVAIGFLPGWLRWVQWLCSLTYGLRIGMIHEFDKCSSDSNTVISENCDLILTQINADPDSEWWYWLILVFLFVFFRLFALIVLKKKAESFY